MKDRNQIIAECAAKAEENKLYWAAKVDPLKPDDPSREIYRAKSAACFQIEMDLRALASLRALAPAPADQSDAGREGVIEECAPLWNPSRWITQPCDKEGVSIIAERSDVSTGATPTNGQVAFVTRRFGETKAHCEERAAFIIRAIRAPASAPSGTVGTEPRGCPTPGACSCPGAVHTGAETVGRRELSDGAIYSMISENDAMKRGEPSNTELIADLVKDMTVIHSADRDAIREGATAMMQAFYEARGGHFADGLSAKAETAYAKLTAALAPLGEG